MEDYQFEPYDVLQITRDGGATWGDYYTIRTKDEAAQSQGMVSRARGRAERYRITRGGAVVFE